MTGFKSLGIITYDDYKKNKGKIFDIYWMMLEEHITKHPEFVQQAMDKSLKNYVTENELNYGNQNVFYVKK